MNYQPYKMLVTGAAGFIGSNFVRMMLYKYQALRIISYDKLTYAGNLDNLKNLPNKQHHSFIQGDICDSDSVLEILKKHDIDTIVHFAAESHVDNAIKNPGVFMQTNVMGTFSLLEAARHYWKTKNYDQSQCRFHHVSTDEVYGTLTQDDPAFNEQNAYAPNSPYSASKAGADHLVRAYFHTYQLPVTISNCSNNYGPYQHPEKLIPVVIKSCINQQSIPVYGDGSNIRDWLFVTDHCEAIDNIIHKGTVGEVYNIGGNNEVDNLTLVKTICSIMDEYRAGNAPHQKLITFVKDRAGHDWRYAIDNTKITKDLSWQPSKNFQQTLKETAEFYLND